jgi:AAA+ superfamily predicted ATPase
MAEKKTPIKIGKIAKETKEEKATETTEVTNEQAVESALGYSQWAVQMDGCYRPTFNTVKLTPAGVYEINQDNNGYYIQKQKVILSDNIMRLPMEQMNEIMGDLENFWNMKDRFKKYNMVYKRGILLHGPPGNGKSYLMQNLINSIVEKNGVVFSLNGEGAVKLFTEFAQTFRAIEKERPLVVIIEDIDNIVTAGQGLLSALLNVLDGVNQIDNVVYLATTNYPERLQDRLSNRPSRFDRVYEIPHASDAVREYYIKHKLHESDLAQIDLKKWVKETDGLSLSHIKELIVSVMILGKKFEDTIQHFGEMKKPKSSRGATKSVGFGIN